MFFFPPTLLASPDLFVKWNVLSRQKRFLFILKTEFQSNDGQFLNLLCLTMPVFIGQLPLRFCDGGNHRALSIPICFFQFPSFLPNLHHFLCPLVFRSFKIPVYCTLCPLSPIISSPQLPVSIFFFCPLTSPFPSHPLPSLSCYPSLPAPFSPLDEGSHPSKKLPSVHISGAHTGSNCINAAAVTLIACQTRKHPHTHVQSGVY